MQSNAGKKESTFSESIIESPDGESGYGRNTEVHFEREEPKQSKLFRELPIQGLSP